MKKILYPALILMTLLIGGFIMVRSNHEKQSIPGYKERKANVTLAGEWLNTKKAIEGLLDKLKRNPDDQKSKFQLALAYIQESRVTGDHAYYDAAALKLLDQILSAKPEDFEALCAKTTILLSQHHFEEALLLAKKSVKLNPDNAYIYGTLCDANVELGNYEEAIKMGDKMVSIRPDIRSYSRISYLREIMGDLDGARDAMKMAVESGYPGLEQTEWCRVQLGHLFEISGDTLHASQHYQAALFYRPDYPYAMLGQARIAKIGGRYQDALQLLQKADQSIIEFSIKDEMTDVYMLNNQMAEAKACAQKVVDMLYYDPAKPVNEQQTHGHYTDRELSFAYLKTNQPQLALKHALIEYHRRPLNIDINETLAWCYYRNHQNPDALQRIQEAMKTQSKNPVLLCRAGMIYYMNGQKDKGKALIQLALKLNPYLDPVLAREAKSILS